MRREYRLRSTKEPVEVISTDHMAPDQSKRLLVRVVKTDDIGRPYHHTYTVFPSGLVNGNPSMESDLDIELKPTEVVVFVGLLENGKVRCETALADDANALKAFVDMSKSWLGVTATKVCVTEGVHHVSIQD